jgi:tetratricopeptide (TPR) repeat protein
VTIENLARAAFLYILRIIQKSRGDFDAAKVALNAALTLSPQFAEAWNGLVADDYSTIVEIGKISPV